MADAWRHGDLPGRLELSFKSTDPSLDPGTERVGLREAYHYLANIDEHPEALPLAQDVVREYLERIERGAAGIPTTLVGLVEQSTSPEVALEHVTRLIPSVGSIGPWHQADRHLMRRQVLHYLTQYVPTALVDGCWLQCGLRVATAHTHVGAQLTAMYVHQVRAYGEDPGRHFVADYREVFARLGAPLEEVSSHSLVERVDLSDTNFELPVLLLSIGQFPRTHLAEVLGLHLGWQFLGLPAFGPALIRDTCAIFDLPAPGADLATEEYLAKGREMALNTVNDFLARQDAAAREGAWRDIGRGLLLAAAVWSSWFERARAAAPHGRPNPRQEMIELLRRKAPHAHGYHGNKKVGERRIDDYLDPKHFDPAGLLDKLAASPHVKADRPEQSALVRRLVEFGGPMLAVFSPLELEIMRDWIRSLAQPSAEAGQPAAAAAVPPAIVEEPPARPIWSREAFRRRSEARYGRCSVRDLYHHLVNVELVPEILPIAERFARDRLERAMATLHTGDRPIPSRVYDPDALEQWVYAKHREQVDSYRPIEGTPRVSREVFIESTVQLAPLILIDGGWLQGMASPSIIHTTVGRMLFHVFCEEVGLGNADEHHANIYRDLLHAMGEDAPPVESLEFAHWGRLRDASFDVPTLWLSISCFPRHFMPEILGLNLAVELAGLGGPYMEARDTLRYYKFPTLFVTVHNAADNVSVGHAAWAMNAIKKYMDELIEREGPHRVEHTWHRIWTGVRATLPQIGRARLIAHRIGRRLFGPMGTGRVPVIFPS